MAKTEKANKYHVLVEMWDKWNPLTCWWEYKSVTSTLENWLALAIKAKFTLALNSTLRYLTQEK